MLCVDVNVLVYAHRKDLAEHRDYRPLFERLANGDENLGLPDLVLGGFVRVMTNRRIFTEPTNPEEAWKAVDRFACRSCGDATSRRRAPLDFVSAARGGHQCAG